MMDEDRKGSSWDESITRREMFRKFGHYSAIAAAVLAASSFPFVWGCDGGRSPGATPTPGASPGATLTPETTPGGTPTPKPTLGKTPETAIPMKLGESFRGIVLRENDIMYFRWLEGVSVVHFDLIITEIDGQFTCGLAIMQDAGLSEVYDDVEVSDRWGLYASLENYLYVGEYFVFESGPRPASFSFEFKEHVDEYSDWNDYSDWSDRYSDYSDWNNRWAHAYSDWSNAWGNWMQSW